MRAKLDSFQIHHDGSLHWLASRIDHDGKVYLYDSLFVRGTNQEIDVQLALLYNSGDSNYLKVSVMSIQKQRDVSDCGLFAAAVCTALAVGQDPTTLRWRQQSMRDHLTRCFQLEWITPFPTVEKKQTRLKISTNLETELKIPLSCICKLPSFTFNYMVECHRCLSWFHKPCVGLADTNESVSIFICSLCKSTKV